MKIYEAFKTMRPKDYVVTFAIIISLATIGAFLDNSFNLKSIFKIFLWIIAFMGFLLYLTKYEELKRELKESRIKKIKEKKPELEDWKTEAEYERRWRENERKADKFKLFRSFPLLWYLIAGLIGLGIFML